MKKDLTQDNLLFTFFEPERWSNAIDKGFNKEIAHSVLRKYCSVDGRLELYDMIQKGELHIEPPHEARIPKDDGTFRTVYVNTPRDRLILSIINDIFFEQCADLIHPRCKSYQHGIGCGKIVQNVSRYVANMTSDVIGVKVDLSKYFDSVPIQFIDKTFDDIEDRLGKSKVMEFVREYYHNNTVIDFDKNIVEKYSSLRQGCAIAAFLADAVLYDIDDEISRLDVYYIRYSDDILILGNEWQKGYEILQRKLQEKSLTLNPKKVEILNKQVWFKFLGFMIKNDKISLSKSRIKSFQKEVENRTFKSKKSHNLKTVTNRVNRYLYVGNGEFSWATSVLPVINVDDDINTLNRFVTDAIRAAVTGKDKIGGLGCTIREESCISRGRGRNVTTNKTKLPNIPDYQTIQCMRNAIVTSKEAYDTLVRLI